MLQYILTESEQYSVAELCQMAIEGGCQWIDLNLQMNDDEIREILVPDIIAMCREAGIFLTIDDRPELARDVGLHGVRFTRGYFVTNPVTPMQLRDTLGPEAVIGIETADATSVADMVAADIDFVCIPAEFTPEQQSKFIEAVRSSELQMPIVAQGNINAENVKDYFMQGFNGVAVGNVITNATDPIAEVRRILDAINK